MITIRIDTALPLAAAAILLAGCGGSDTEQASTPPPSPPGVSAQAGSTETEQASDRVVLDVSIQGSTVTPTNEQLQAEVGQPIVLRVDSDTADELHVHSTPEHTFPVAARPGQTFEFTVDMPGRVDIELHDKHTTIATILVR